MKTLLLASTLIALCAVALVRAQDVVRDVIVAFGDRYRLSGVNNIFMVLPEGPLEDLKPPSGLTRDERLSRCDQFVAIVLGSQSLGGPGTARLVRVRVDGRPDHGNLVRYE